MTAIGGYVKRKDRVKQEVYDRFYDGTHCPNCGANYKYVAMWPHICKEILYQSMPILNFVPFEVDNKE